MAWKLTEAIAPSSLEKELTPHKKKVTSKEAEDYIDILEFTVQWLGAHANVNDKEFKTFMGWVKKMVGKGEAEASLRGKTPQVQDIEKKVANDEPVEANPEDVQEIPPEQQSKQQVKPSTPPPLPKRKDKDKEKEKEEKPEFGAAPEAPSLANLSGKPEKGGEEGDMWDKMAQKAKDLHKDMPKTELPPGQPLDTGDDLKPAPSSKSQRFKTGATQNWAPGKVVDVGFVKNLLIKGKHGRYWRLVAKNGQEYVFEPHNGLKKVRK